VLNFRESRSPMACRLRSFGDVYAHVEAGELQLRRPRSSRGGDGGEGRWIDVSAWFWASQYGGGPWWAVTVVTPIESGT
jgi:hypothetical protein